MWVEEKGTSADPADMTVVCGCGKSLSLQELFQPGRLGSCRGERPWLLDRDPNGCGQKLKLLTRTATNTYFPQVYTVISLPTEEDELTRLVDSVSGRAEERAIVPRTWLPRSASIQRLRRRLDGYSDDETFARLQRLREGAIVDAGGSPKLSEFDVFASGRPEIGQNSPAAKLYAQTLPRDAWAASRLRVDLSAIKNVVAVHRLREVSCLYGFTRFEAAPTSADGDLEDIQLAVRGAPLAQDADWLPAIEQFGEGIFIHFDEAAIGEWLQRDATRHRHDELMRGYGHWCTRFGGHAPHYPGTAYVLLHSLSHALTSEIALDCGYPASSLKERVYALSGPDGAPERCGILIYTATAGAQGTLGGLVGTAPRFAQILEGALERSRFARTIRSVPIINRTIAAAIVRRTEQRATAAYSSLKRAARCAICFSIATYWCLRWRLTTRPSLRHSHADNSASWYCGVATTSWLRGRSTGRACGTACCRWLRTGLALDETSAVSARRAGAAPCRVRIADSCHHHLVRAGFPRWCPVC